MTRAHIADPALVGKAGTGEPVIPCIGCNQGCIGHYHAGTPIACVVNVRTGRERLFTSAVPSGGRRVLVVGAGPAGLAAAVEAASLGHAVRLIEAAPGIGGQFRVAGLAPAHTQAWASYQTWVSAELRRLGVDLRLGTAATAADADGPGETVHQYQRSRYLARLDELGVTVRAHTELVVRPDALLLRNIHSGRESVLTAFATVVTAAGRVPHDPLWADLEGAPGVTRVGDVLSPRGLEEAVLEGAMAVREHAIW